MQDGCKVYMDSYMASYGSCFMITRLVSKNHLLEVGLTQNEPLGAKGPPLVGEGVRKKDVGNVGS